MKPQPHTGSADARHPLFTENAGLWEAASQSIRKKHFDRNDRVISHSDDATQLWLVYRGWIKLSRQTPDGKETIVGLCTEGDMFGEAALFFGASYPYTAEILSEDAELSAIPSSTIRHAIAQNASLAANIMALMSERMSQAQLKLEHMHTMSAAQRLGCFFLRICHSQNEGTKTLHIPIEKHVLAAYLGMKPETLSRSQQQLKPLGIAVSGATITIENIRRLREFVCESCSESGTCMIESAIGELS